MFQSQQRRLNRNGPFPSPTKSGHAKPSQPEGMWHRLATHTPVLSATGTRLQPKLTVGAPDDIYEQEADRVADQVMRMPEAGGSTPDSHRSECDVELQRQPVEEEEELVQSKAETSGSAKVAAAHSLQGLRGGGEGLPSQSRAYFEPRFGRDFSSVRIHTGPDAEAAATALRAKAFTTGTDIVFNKGNFAPEHSEGQRLLAHELTHVVQQSSGLEGGLVQRDDEEEEQQFDYTILPPSLRYRYGPFSIGADTSAARMGLSTGQGDFGLGYSYGSDIFATGRWGDLSTRFGVNPSSGALSFGGSYGGFNLGLSGNPGQRSFGASIGYGAPLLPMPSVLGEQAGAAWQGAMGVGGALPEFINDPLGTYGAQSGNIDALSTFGGSLSQIYGQQEQGEGLPFGFGARLSYDPLARWMFSAGLQGHF